MTVDEARKAYATILAVLKKERGCATITSASPGAARH